MTKTVAAPKLLPCSWLVAALVTAACGHQAQPTAGTLSANESSRANLIDPAREFLQQMTEPVNSDPAVWPTLWKNHHLANKSLVIDLFGGPSQLPESQLEGALDRLVADALGSDMFRHKFQQQSSEALQAIDALSDELRGALDVLSQALPVDQPVDMYLMSFVPQFDGMEFSQSTGPAFAANLYLVKDYTPDMRKLLGIHESFHVLHMRKMIQYGSGNALEASGPGVVMREGLAVFVTKQLVPGLGDNVYTFLPQNDIVSCETNLKAFAAAMLERWESAEKMNADFFTGGKSPGSWPARAGYYMGLKILERLQGQHGYKLQDFYAMKPEEFAPLLRQVLEDFARPNQVSDLARAGG